MPKSKEELSDLSDSGSASSGSDSVSGNVLK